MLTTKTPLVILTLLLFSTKTFSQEIQWAEDIQSSKSKDCAFSFIGDDSENIYSSFSDDGKKFLTAFSRSSLKPVFEEQIPKLTVDKQKIKTYSPIFCEDKYIIFGTFIKKNKKTKTEKKSIKYNIVAFTADKHSGEVNTKPIKLCDIEIEKDKKRGKFRFYTSPDNSKILISHIAFHEKKQITIGHYKLFDNNLNLIQEFSENFTKNNKGNRMLKNNNNIVINDKGSIYYRIGFKKIVFLDASKNYEKHVENLSFEKKIINTRTSRTKFTFDREGNIILFGFYNKYKYDKRVGLYDGELKGTYYIKIDPKIKKIISQKISDFDALLLAKLTTLIESRKVQYVEEARNNGRLASEMTIKIDDIFNKFDFSFQEDGSLAVVAESMKRFFQYSEESLRDQNNKEIDRYKYLSSKNYQYDDFLVLNISPKGDLKWIKHIPKKQYFYQSSNSDRSCTRGTFNGGFKLGGFIDSFNYTKYFSTISSVSNKKITVIYNSHLKNTFKTHIKDIKTLEKIKNAAVNAAVYDVKTGGFKSKKVLNGDQKLHPLCPRVHYKTKDKQSIIVFGQINKNYRLGKLILN